MANEHMRSCSTWLTVLESMKKVRGHEKNLVVSLQASTTKQIIEQNYIALYKVLRFPLL